MSRLRSIWGWISVRKPRPPWEIQPQDLHLNPAQPEISFFIRDGWEPFGTSAVPNTLDPNQIRLWTRRPANHKNMRDYDIKIASAGWGGHEVFLHLTAGWKPFCVSDSYGNHIIWFCRAV